MAIVASPSGVTVEGEKIGEFSLLETDPTGEDVPEMNQALASLSGRPAWIALPETAGFFVVRKLVNTARQAGLEPVVLSSTGGARAYPITKAKRYGLGMPCPEGPLTVQGTQPLVTVWIQTGRDGTWLLGEARHLPVVAQGEGVPMPTDFLDAACIRPPDCAALYSGARQTLCRTDPGPQEVRLGGDHSACLVPLAREGSNTAGWPQVLAPHLTRLGIKDQPLVKVVPETQSPVAALLATLEGFRLAGVPTPSVATTLLIEGNDGPLDCVRPAQTVRSADDLADAGARYLGSIAAE